jgi:hypothetical protein
MDVMPDQSSNPKSQVVTVVESGEPDPTSR